MAAGIMGATVEEGALQGWPLGAALAIGFGKDPDGVRAGMIVALEAEQERIGAQIAALRLLPDPRAIDPKAVGRLAAFAPAENLMRQRG